jgi:predicted benzoate:H+ symporter BenE
VSATLISFGVGAATLAAARYGAATDPSNASQYGIATIISAICGGAAMVITALTGYIKARNSRPAHPRPSARKSRARTRQQILAQRERLDRELAELDDDTESVL